MFRGIEVKDLPAAMADHEEAIKHTERYGRYREEIHRGHDLSMVLQKTQPLLSSISPTVQTSKITGHRTLGNVKAQLQELAVNPWRSPEGILVGDALNELTKSRGDSWPTRASMGTKAPVKAKPGTMPAYDRVRFHDDQHLGPPRP